MNVCNYVGNDPLNATDPAGRVIEVQHHDVKMGVSTGSDHTNIRFTPENQSKYEGDARFLSTDDKGNSVENIDDNGNRYTVFGGGPKGVGPFAKLKSDLNRSSDIGQQDGSVEITLPDDG